MNNLSACVDRACSTGPSMQTCRANRGSAGLASFERLGSRFQYGLRHPAIGKGAYAEQYGVSKQQRDKYDQGEEKPPVEILFSTEGCAAAQDRAEGDVRCLGCKVSPSASQLAPTLGVDRKRTQERQHQERSKKEDGSLIPIRGYMERGPKCYTPKEGVTRDPQDAPYRTRLLCGRFLSNRCGIGRQQAWNGEKEGDRQDRTSKIPDAAAEVIKNLTIPARFRGIISHRHPDNDPG